MGNYQVNRKRVYPLKSRDIRQLFCTGNYHICKGNYFSVLYQLANEEQKIYTAKIFKKKITKKAVLRNLFNRVAKSVFLSNICCAGKYIFIAQKPLKDVAKINKSFLRAEFLSLANLINKNSKEKKR